MYPLFVASQFREGRDRVLLDLNPVADPEICARALVQAVDTSNDDRFGHGWLRGMHLLTLVNSYRPGSVGLRELIFEASTTSSDIGVCRPAECRRGEPNGSRLRFHFRQTAELPFPILQLYVMFDAPH